MLGEDCRSPGAPRSGRVAVATGLVLVLVWATTSTTARSETPATALVFIDPAPDGATVRVQAGSVAAGASVNAATVVRELSEPIPDEEPQPPATPSATVEEEAATTPMLAPGSDPMGTAASTWAGLPWGVGPGCGEPGQLAHGCQKICIEGYQPCIQPGEPVWQFVDIALRAVKYQGEKVLTSETAKGVARQVTAGQVSIRTPGANLGAPLAPEVENAVRGAGFLVPRLAISDPDPIHHELFLPEPDLELSREGGPWSLDAPARPLPAGLVADASPASPTSVKEALSPASEAGAALEDGEASSTLGGVASQAAMRENEVLTPAFRSGIGFASAFVLGLSALALLSLYHRIQSSRVLEHADRARIHERVKEERGVITSDLARALGVNLSTARHHLRTLQRAGLVRRVRAGRATLWFPMDGLPADAIVTRASTRAAQVLARVTAEPGLTLTEYAARLGISKSHAHYHFQRLVAGGAVCREARPGRSSYHPAARPVQGCGESS